jgi:hypothetical protein
MRTKSNSAKQSASSAKKAQLCISYPSKTVRRKRERRVVYLRLGSPPITSVEVELMRAHLEARGSDQNTPVANNDNSTEGGKRP